MIRAVLLKKGGSWNCTSCSQWQYYYFEYSWCRSIKSVNLSVYDDLAASVDHWDDPKRACLASMQKLCNTKPRVHNMEQNWFFWQTAGMWVWQNSRIYANSQHGMSQQQPMARMIVQEMMRMWLEWFMTSVWSQMRCPDVSLTLSPWIFFSYSCFHLRFMKHLTAVCSSIVCLSIGLKICVKHMCWYFMKAPRDTK